MSQLTVKKNGIVPLTLVADQLGGVAGLVCDVLVRDPVTGLSLDWADLTFKAGGHTALRLVMADVGGGLYEAALDLSAVTNLPDPTSFLTAVFRSPAPVAGTDYDTITIEPDILDDELTDSGVTVRQTLRATQASLAGKIVRVGDVYHYRDTLDTVDVIRLQDGDTERTVV